MKRLMLLCAILLAAALISQTVAAGAAQCRQDCKAGWESCRAVCPRGSAPCRHQCNDAFDLCKAACDQSAAPDPTPQTGASNGQGSANCQPTGADAASTAKPDHPSWGGNYDPAAKAWLGWDLSTQGGITWVQNNNPQSRDDGCQNSQQYAEQFCYQNSQDKWEPMQRMVQCSDLGAGWTCNDARGGCAPPQPVCGNGVLESGEQCDGGASNGLACPATCSTTCTTRSCPPNPVCGNGITEGTEQCDAGASNGNACPATCSTTCTTRNCPGSPVCGNGVVESSEQCDAGASNGNACPATCSTTCTTRNCPTNNCNDGDGGQNWTVSTSAYGRLKNANNQWIWVTMVDTCSGNQQVEQFCQTPLNLKNTTRDCPTGTTCSGGVCITSNPPTGPCSAVACKNYYAAMCG